MKKLKNTRKFSVHIAFVLLIQFTGLAQYNGGDGSSGSPYLINSVSDLLELSNTSSDWSKHFELTSNLDMSGQNFSPIGNKTTSFTGSFEGGFNIIENLTVTPPSDLLDGTGLFGVVNGTVKQLGIKNIVITANGYSRVAAFVGVLESGGTISECYSDGGSIDVGNGGWTGSIVGTMFSGGTRTVQDCYSTTSINGSWGCGGIVGVTRGDHIIDKVCFYGSVSGGNAIVSVQNDPGDNEKNGVPGTNAFFASSTGATDADAVGLTDSELLNPANYTTFDLTDIWEVDSDLGYAVLQFEKPELPFFEKIRTQRVASEEDVEWVNFGPGTSGYCEEFWCHPTDTNVMFSGPDMHAAFGTWDDGKTWQTLKDWDGTGVKLRRIHDIVFSTQNPDFGLLLEREGEIFKTLDRGKSWSLVKDLGKAHTKIVIHPSNDNIWFVGAGDFWNVKENHRSLASPNGEILSRADYGYVWKTSDKGQTWKKVADGIDANLDVGRIVFNPADPSIMIMAAGHGMFRSTDTGETWTESSNGLPHNLPRDLTSYYNSSNGEFVLYSVEQTKYTPNGTEITAAGGVYKSTDAGLSWVNITGNLGLNLQTITDYSVRDRYHRSVAYWLGISKSESKALYTTYPTWTIPVFNRIKVNPINKNEIYLVHNKKHDKGFGPGDLWKTEDGGLTWFACARNGTYWINETDKTYWETKNNPLGANVDFAHLQVSMDNKSESSGNRMLEINSKGDVFIGIDQQLLRSNDHGVSWSQIDDDETAEDSNKWIGRGNTNLPGRFLLLETGVEGRKLLCSGEHGLWQTTDLGDWPDANAVAVEQIEGQVHDHSGNHGAHSISTVAVHPNDPNTIYFLSWRQEHRGKVRKSTDGGATWTNIATLFEADNGSWESVAMQYSLLIDPVNPDNMFFTSIYKPISEVGGGTGVDLTLGEYGVYRSTDGGYNWSVSNDDFPSGSSINRIAMHPDNPSLIYAAMNQWGTNDPGGLYKSTDGAVNFSKMSLPTQIKSVNNIFIDRNTKDMFICTGSRSGTLEGGGVWKSTDDGSSWVRIFEAPYVWQAEVSPANSNIITISVAAQIPSMTDQFLNPGVYISQDAGSTWFKINKGLAHSDRIVDLKPDPIDENVLWCAGWGSAWYKAILPSGNLSVAPVDLPKDKAYIYPNPVEKGVIYVRGYNGDAINFGISDTTGRTWTSGTLEGNDMIDVSFLKTGVYIVKIYKDNNLELRQIIIVN